MLFIAFGFILLIVALTRPGPTRLFRDRTGPRPPEAPDPTAGLRDPARPF